MFYSLFLIRCVHTPGFLIILYIIVSTSSLFFMAGKQHSNHRNGKASSGGRRTRKATTIGDPNGPKTVQRSKLLKSAKHILRRCMMGLVDKHAEEVMKQHQDLADLTTDAKWSASAKAKVATDELLKRLEPIFPAQWFDHDERAHDMSSYAAQLALVTTEVKLEREKVEHEKTRKERDVLVTKVEQLTAELEAAKAGKSRLSDELVAAKAKLLLAGNAAVQSAPGQQVVVEDQVVDKNVSSPAVASAEVNDPAPPGVNGEAMDEDEKDTPKNKLRVSDVAADAMEVEKQSPDVENQLGALQVGSGSEQSTMLPVSPGPLVETESQKEQTEVMRELDDYLGPQKESTPKSSPLKTTTSAPPLANALKLVEQPSRTEEVSRAASPEPRSTSKQEKCGGKVKSDRKKASEKRGEKGTILVVCDSIGRNNRRLIERAVDGNLEFVAVGGGMVTQGRPDKDLHRLTKARLQRLESLDAFCLFLAGGNDVCDKNGKGKYRDSKQRSARQLAEGIIEIYEMVRHKFPHCNMRWAGLPPRDTVPGYVQGEVFERVEKYFEDKYSRRQFFIDNANTREVKVEGKWVLMRLSSDGIHPSERCPVLKQMVVEMMADVVKVKVQSRLGRRIRDRLGQKK